jgi:hypothetical protein
LEELAKKYPWLRQRVFYERPPGERLFGKLKAWLLLRKGRRKEAAWELIKNFRAGLSLEHALRRFNEWSFSGENRFLEGLNEDERKRISERFDYLRKIDLNPKLPLGGKRPLYIRNTLLQAAEMLGIAALSGDKPRKVRNKILTNAAILDILAEPKVSGLLVELEARRLKQKTN